MQIGQCYANRKLTTLHILWEYQNLLYRQFSPIRGRHILSFLILIRCLYAWTNGAFKCFRNPATLPCLRIMVRLEHNNENEFCST